MKNSSKIQKLNYQKLKQSEKMRYKSLIFIILFFAAIITAMELNKEFETRVLNVGDRIKMFFINSVNFASNAYDRYFNQADSIKDLQSKLLEYENLKMQNILLQNEKNQLIAVINETTNQKTALELDGDDSQLKARFYLAYLNSYVNMQEPKKAWLYLKDRKNLNENQIFGVLRNGVVVGISKLENGRLKAYLNGSKECSYSVVIGAQNTPGIINGSLETSDSRLIMADYIPKWADVKAGDEVYASGLDGIFLPNTPVGVVTEIIDSQNAIKAKIASYSQETGIGYIWIIDTKSSVRSQAEEVQ